MHLPIIFGYLSATMASAPVTIDGAVPAVFLKLFRELSSKGDVSVCVNAATKGKNLVISSKWDTLKSIVYRLKAVTRKQTPIFDFADVSDEVVRGDVTAVFGLFGPHPPHCVGRKRDAHRVHRRNFQGHACTRDGSDLPGVCRRHAGHVLCAV